MIECNNLGFEAGGRSILSKISFSAEEGEILGFIGRSGSGKTILLKLLAGIIGDYTGSCLHEGIPLKEYIKEKKFLKIAYCGNANPENIDETVSNFLHLPRIPYKRFFKSFSDYDVQIIDGWLNQFGLSGLGNSPLRVLSDSLLRSAVLANAFVSEAQLLILDDPTVYLDLESISRLHTAVKKYAINGERTVLLGGNDINFILQASDRIIILDNGAIRFSGAPEALTREILKGVYGVDLLVSRNIYNGKPEVHIFPE